MSPTHTTPGPMLLLRMTRPAFLLLTVVACVLGTATASACGCGLDWSLALGATALAVLAHAAGNVLNDLHDARNGADAANSGGIGFGQGVAHDSANVVCAQQTGMEVVAGHQALSRPSPGAFRPP